MKRNRPANTAPHHATGADAGSPAGYAALKGYLFRGWIAAMYAATIWVTRRLWTEHSSPPLLPLVELPTFDHYGELLLMTLAVYVVRPRLGLALNVVVAATAMVADQTRMQPQIFSFWFLMLGACGGANTLFLARCHLSALWFFSGLHKLLSPGYFADVAPWMWRIVFPPADDGIVRAYAAAIAGFEIALGAALWFRRLRVPEAIGGFLLHVGVVLMLRSDNNWNTSVWPWNLAIAAASAIYIGGWRTPLRDDWRTVAKPVWLAGAVLVLSPALFYRGKLDAYLSYCLYSANVPTAYMFPASDAAPYQIQSPYWTNLNVPQPPAHRNFATYFSRVSRPGDSMVVEDPRRWAKSCGLARYAWRNIDGRIERISLPPSGLPQK